MTVSTDTLTVICAWCPDNEEKTRVAIDAGKTVSHGMCPDCTKKMEDLATTKYDKKETNE